MLDADGSSIFNALYGSIRRIMTAFDRDWLITGEAAKDMYESDFSSSSTNARFEKIIEPENHSYTEICICLEGNCALQLKDYIFELNQGEVCLIMPGITHCELPRRECNYLALWMSLDIGGIAVHLSGKNSENGFFYTLDGFSSNPFYEYSMIISSLKTELSNKSAYYREVVKTHVLQLLATILRKVGEAGVTKTNSTPWKESVVSQVRDYIERNYSKNIRLAEISQEVCISGNYLNTIFKSITGHTIIQYVENFRINKAKELLRCSDSSAGSIAAQLGYYDQYHFSKIFKKETGYTPTQFRKLQ